MLTVLYDGGCPLCRLEIAYYRQLKALEPIVWFDLSSEQPLPVAISRCEALRRFHLVDDQQQTWHGARAFIRLWQALPGWRWLASGRHIPGFATVLEWGYLLALKIRPKLAALLH
jgi:predicted DCC family thiol-disulfide oxidoreductase YuxK